MAGLTFDQKTGIARIHFRYCGRQYQKSLKTSDPKEAEGTKGRVEDTLRAIENGWLEVPTDADIWYFLRSQGKMDKKPELAQVVTLGELFKWYFDQQPPNGKEANTLATEHIHAEHVLQLMGRKTPLLSIRGRELQEGYINQRAKARWHKKPIRPETVQKEIKTLRMVWNRAARLGVVKGSAPTDGLSYPKTTDKAPFQTWEEVERIIARGRLTQAEQEGLWHTLFLTREQVEQVLEFARTKKTRNPYFYPLLVFAAHTGARRSEMMRSRVDDFKIDERQVVIREKKRAKDRETFRRVSMSDLLAKTMSAYFATGHPGGAYTLCREPDKPLLAGTLAKAFESFFRGSKWNVLHGYHVFRHSFASNLARVGIEERVVDELMGHQTQAMRRRYRHLFPEQRENAIKKLFG
jgi:integrase